MQSAKKIARDQPKFTALRSHYLREWGDRGLIFWTSLLPVEVTRTIKDQGDFSMTAFSRILAVYLLTQLIMEMKSGRKEKHINIMIDWCFR